MFLRSGKKPRTVIPLKLPSSSAHIRSLRGLNRQPTQPKHSPEHHHLPLQCQSDSSIYLSFTDCCASHSMAVLHLLRTTQTLSASRKQQNQRRDRDQPNNPFSATYPLSMVGHCWQGSLDARERQQEAQSRAGQTSQRIQFSHMLNCTQQTALSIHGPLHPSACDLRREGNSARLPNRCRTGEPRLTTS
jgi:hypothetical protein